MIELNGCSIEAYPSNHIDAFRSLTNPKFILLDEARFYALSSNRTTLDMLSERYIAKSDPFIVMVSTPNAPGGLFERIEKEPFDTCIYKKIFLDYTYGLGKIYTKEEIEKATNVSFISKRIWFKVPRPYRKYLLTIINRTLPKDRV